MNTKGIKFLTVLAVLALAFSVFAIAAPSEQNDADIPSDVTTVSTEAEFRTAVTGAADFNVKLGADLTLSDNTDNTVTGYLVKSKGIIDFNGHKITVTVLLSPVTTTASLDAEVGKSSVIVNESSNLTLKDSSSAGTGGIYLSFDNNASRNGNGAISNLPGAVLTIESGKYWVDNSNITEGAENQTTYNYWYTVKNTGTMTVNGGTFIGMNHYWGAKTDPSASSMFANGWFTGSKNTGAAPATLTINGGTFDKGLNTIKNDDYGVAVINGGTFSNTLQATLFNWNDLTVNAGTFTGSSLVAVNGYLAAYSYDCGKMAINGGSFEGTFAINSGSNGVGTITTALKNGIDVVVSAALSITGTGMIGEGVNIVTDKQITLNTEDITILGTVTFKEGGKLLVGSDTWIDTVGTDSSAVVSTNSTGGFDVTINGSVTAGAAFSLGASSTEAITDTLTLAKSAVFTGSSIVVGKNGVITAGASSKIAAASTSAVLTNNGTIVLGTGATIGDTTTAFANTSVAGNIENAVYKSTGKNVYITDIENSVVTDAVPSALVTGKIYQISTAVTGDLTLESGAATIIAPSVTGDIAITTGSVTINSTYTGKITTGTGVAACTIEFVNAKGAFTVTQGSDLIKGTIESGTVKILNADTKLNGALVIESDARLQIDAGAVLYLDGNTLTNNGTILGDGYIQTCADDDPEVEAGTIINNGTIYVDIISDWTEVSTAQELIDALASTDYIRLASADSFVIDKNVDVPQGKVIDLNGRAISILSGMTFSITKSQIIDTSDAADPGVIVQSGGVFKITTADVLTPVQKITGGTIIVKEKVQTISGQSITTNIAVGYGNTLVLDGITIESGNAIVVYGDLQVKNRVIVNSGAIIDIAHYGTSTVDGTLQVAGNVYVDGSMAVNGNVTVAGNVGNSASFEVTSEKYEGVYVNLGATFTVSKPSNDTYSNTLKVTVPEENDYDTFLVYGALNVYGSMDAQIYDAGEITIQGTIIGDYSYITIDDGVTINVNSITGKSLYVTDEAILDSALYNLKGQSYGSEYNTIELKNVKNVTISELVTTAVESDGSAKYFYTNMDISGTVATTGNNGTITVQATKTTYWYTAAGVPTSDATARGPSGSERFGYIYVTDTLALGKNVTLTYNGGTFIVDGSITALAEGSDIINSLSAEGTGNAITVNGSITMGGKNNNQVKIDSTYALNAAYFTVTDIEMDVTGYYASFDGAFEYIADADEKTIFTYGKVTQTGEATLEAGQSITVTSGTNSKLTIKGTFTAAKESTISNSATIEVTGTLVITDYYGTLTGNEPQADVMFADEPMRTYCSLSGAIKAGQTDIVLNRNASVRSDLTIPEGVKVSSDTYNITVSRGKVLTVDGAIELAAGTINLTKANTTTPAASLIVNGHVFVATEDASSTSYTGLANVDGAHFDKTVNGLTKKFISSIDYAAENTTDYSTNYDITIIGKVVGGDVVFTPGSYGTITITIPNDSGTDVNYLAVKSITLMPGVTLTAVKESGTNVNAGKFAGEIYAYTGDGTEMSSIVVSEGTSFTANASEVEKVAGMEYFLNLKSTSGTVAFGGSFLIDEGTVTISDASKIGVATGDRFLVGLDAELVLGADLTTGTDADDVRFAVAGLVTVDGKTLTIDCLTVVTGEIDVVNGGTLDINEETAILGDIYVSEELGKAGTFTIDAVIYLGSKPTELNDTGSIIGPATLDDDDEVYIVVYPGFDLSEAKINWNYAEEKSALVYTDYVIDDMLYMTVLATNSVVGISTPIDNEEFEIDGIQNDLLDDASGDYMVYWFIDEGFSKKLPTGNKVGDYDTVYAKVVAANVDATITVGAGLYLYIDGVAYQATYTPSKLAVGAHTVSTELLTGYDGDNVTITFNGTMVPVTKTGGIIVVESDMDYVVLIADGAVPHVEPEPEPVTPEEKSEWTITTILLCILVVLIAIMAVIVALRLNRN